jgi:hypothetical protein
MKKTWGGQREHPAFALQKSELYKWLKPNQMRQ